MECYQANSSHDDKMPFLQRNHDHLPGTIFDPACSSQHVARAEMARRKSRRFPSAERLQNRTGKHRAQIVHQSGRHTAGFLFLVPSHGTFTPHCEKQRRLPEPAAAEQHWAITRLLRQTPH